MKLSCAKLPQHELDALTSYAAKATWPAGFAIYQRGSPADGLFVIVRGRVVLRNRVKAGRGFVPMIASDGETFGAEGLSPNATYVTDARADEETETYHLSGARFRAFVRERPQNALALIGQVTAEHAMLLGKLRELATLSVEQRLVAAVGRLARHRDFVSADGRIILTPTQYRLLCELVGATRESVTLVVNRLVAQGLAERKGGDFLIAPAHQLLQRIEADSYEGEMAIPLIVGGDMPARRAEA